MENYAEWLDWMVKRRTGADGIGEEPKLPYTNHGCNVGGGCNGHWNLDGMQRYKQLCVLVEADRASATGKAVEKAYLDKMKGVAGVVRKRKSTPAAQETRKSKQVFADWATSCYGGARRRKTNACSGAASAEPPARFPGQPTTMPPSAEDVDPDKVVAC